MTEQNQCIQFDRSDDDVRKVFVRTVTHRTRVLNGPRDEMTASTIFNATDLNKQQAQWPTGRRTVAEIIKEILDSV